MGVSRTQESTDIYFARANGDDGWQLSFNSYPGGLAVADGRLFMSGGCTGGKNYSNGKLLELDLSKVWPIDLDSIPNSVWKKHWRKPPLSDLPVAKVIAEGGVVRAVSNDTVYFGVDPWKTVKKTTKASLPKGLYKICKDQVSRIETREMRWDGQWYVGERGRIWIGLCQDIAKFIDPTNDVMSELSQTIVGMEPLEMVKMGHPLAPSWGGGLINWWKNSGIHAHQGLFPLVMGDSQAGLLKLYSIETDSWKATKVYEEPLTRRISDCFEPRYHYSRTAPN